MASPVPAKSQAAPGFSLPHWKLTKNHSNNHHRGRRSADSSPQQLPPHETTLGQSPVRKESPMRDSSSESESGHEDTDEKREKSFPQAEGGKHGSVGSSSSDQAAVKADKPAEVSDRDKDEAKESNSNIHFRVKRKYTKKIKPCEAQGGWKAPCTEGAEVDESLAKKWNLRPRRHIPKQSDTDEGNPPMTMAETKVKPPQSLPKGSEIRSAPLLLEAAQKERPKFSISLTREEIEEDIYAMSGFKPSRRVKKRPKSVQKQLDNVFPGLWLSSTVTPDAYKVSTYRMKD